MMSGRDDMRFEAPHDFGPERREWHIERTINVSEVFGAICLVASVIWLGGRLEEQVGQLWRTRTEDVSRYERQRAEDLARQQRDRDEVMLRLQAIDNKLDRALQAGTTR